jgi:hypothetical protein
MLEEMYAPPSASADIILTQGDVVDHRVTSYTAEFRGARLEFEHSDECGSVWVMGLHTPKRLRRQGLMTHLVRWLVSQPGVRVIIHGALSRDGAAFAPAFDREIDKAGKAKHDFHR